MSFSSKVAFLVLMRHVEVTTNGVKTGDDSPLTQLAFMLFAASAAILLIIFLKKKDEKDIMK